MSRVRRASFVVRVVEDQRGQVSGVIERVATGAKEAFTSLEAIGQIITRMLQGAWARPLAPSVPPPASGGKSGLGQLPEGGSVRKGATD